MAYYSQNGSGIDAWAYIYVQLQVTRTDYATYSHFDLKSVAVSDTGTSGFIRGQVTTNQGVTSWTAVTGWKDVYYNSTTTLAISSFDVDRGASDKTVRCGAYAEGGGTGIYAGGTDYAWLNVTVPKVLAPNAPTGCTATYVSDSQASVSWTNGTTDSDHPRDATLVERRDGSNDWTQVASVGGSATSYTDNGISANTQYQYRVRAKNVAGYSAYSTSGSIYTTPTAPSSVTLDKTAATTVQVDVTGTWGYSVTYDIESTYDGGSTWASVATSTSLPYSATVNAGTVQFRVRAVRGALSSAWTLSASLVTICPPLAPTIVQAPANPTAYGDGSTVAWTPNHPDGSTQSAAQVKVTNPGGTSTTYTVSTATSYSFTPNATGTWTAQVRTKGLDPSYGEWSQTVSWGVYNPPSVVITSPATDGTDVVSLPMTVSWSVTDSTGVSAQRIIIEGDGGEILNRTLAGDVRNVALNASDVALENGQTYTIRLRVMGGSGLVTEQTRIFDVAWLAPAAPVLQLTEGEGESATIDVMDTHYSESGATIAVDGSAIADSFTVYGKSTQDGTPTPSAPVAIESIGTENLLGNLVAGDYSALGITCTVDSDGVVSIGGTSTSRGNIIIPFEETVPNPIGVSKYMHLRNSKAPNSISVTLQPSTAAYNGNTFAASSIQRIGSVNNIDSISTFGSIRFWIGNGITIPDMTLQPSLEYTLSPTRYPRHGAANVEMVGINRVESLLSEPYSYSGSSYFTDFTVNNGSIAPTKLEEGVTYTLSMNVESSVYPTRFSVGAGNGVYSSDVADSPQITQAGRYSATFTPTAAQLASGSILAFRAPRYSATTTYTATISDVQLEIGSTATPYQPYEGDTYPIDLQGNSLCSLPDGTRDEVRVGERKVLAKRVGHVLLDGSETFYMTTSGYQTYFDYVDSTAPLVYGATTFDKRAYTMSNITTDARNPDNPNVSDASIWVYAFTSDTQGIRVRLGGGVISSLTSVAALQQWLAATNVEILYKLATPQEIDLGAVSDYPFIPEDGEMWVDGTEMEAVLRPADYAGQPTIQSVDVQRVNADGTAWTVATGLTVGGSCIDPLPPLGVPVTYRATASAASGSTASSDFLKKFGGRSWVLNFGNAAQEFIEFSFSPETSNSLTHGGTGYHFADGGAGNGLPVFYPTTDRDISGTWKFNALGAAKSHQLKALLMKYPTAWLRDPFGERFRAHVNPSASHGSSNTWVISMDWEAERFREAWDG